jgi:hypothetical protein
MRRSYKSRSMSKNRNRNRNQRCEKIETPVTAKMSAPA